MERDKDEDASQLQICSHQNQKLPAAAKNSNTVGYGKSLLDEHHDHNLFEGILSGEGMQHNSCVSQLASSSNIPKLTISNIVSPSTANTFKRAISSPYWNNEVGGGDSIEASSSGKRFHGDLNSGSTATDDNSNSFVSLLNQLPQNLPFLSSLGDRSLRQQFQLPSMNWN